MGLENSNSWPRMFFSSIINVLTTTKIGYPHRKKTRKKPNEFPNSYFH